MKYRILLFIPAIFLLSMKPEVLKIEDVYEDPANLLMRSEVIDLPGQSITELKSKVENWGETYLANTKELWTDRADKSTKFNCLIPFEVESLIGGGLLTVYYYAVVMVEFKEGKVRYKV